jgi:uncharacterized protein with PQ loop repeat
MRNTLSKKFLDHVALRIFLAGSMYLLWTFSAFLVSKFHGHSVLVATTKIVVATMFYMPLLELVLVLSVFEAGHVAVRVVNAFWDGHDGNALEYFVIALDIFVGGGV